MQCRLLVRCSIFVLLLGLCFGSFAVSEDIGVLKFTYPRYSSKKFSKIKEEIAQYYDEIKKRYAFNDITEKIDIIISPSETAFSIMYGGSKRKIFNPAFRKDGVVYINPKKILSDKYFILSVIREKITDSFLDETFDNVDEISPWLSRGIKEESELVFKKMIYHTLEAVLLNYYTDHIKTTAEINNRILSDKYRFFICSVASAAFWALNSEFGEKNFKGYINYLRKIQGKAGSGKLSFSENSLNKYFGTDLSSWGGWFEKSPDYVMKKVRSLNTEYKVFSGYRAVQKYPEDIYMSVKSLYSTKQPIRFMVLYKVDADEFLDVDDDFYRFTHDRTNFRKIKEIYVNANRMTISGTYRKLAPGFYVLYLYKGPVGKSSSLCYYAFRVPFIVKK